MIYKLLWEGWYIDTIKKIFSQELNKCLKIKYGKRLKNSEFATYYNLNFNRSITSETARKWLLGVSVPNISVMKDLVYWLNMNLSDLFEKEPQSKLKHIKEKS